MDVEVEFADQDDCGCMLPGYSADIEVILDQHSDVLRIPTQAVSEGQRVFVVGEDDYLEERTIEVGLRNWAWTEVSGRPPGGRKARHLHRSRGSRGGRAGSGHRATRSR